MGNSIARLLQKRGMAFVIGLAVIAGVLFLLVTQPRIIQRLELNIYDTFLTLVKRPEPSPIPVIVDIDDKALAEYGQWPWPRYLIADLLDKLTDKGVAVVAFDMVFAEEDRSSPENIRRMLMRDRGIDFSFSGADPASLDFDKKLAEAVARSPVVLGGYARFTGEPNQVVIPHNIGVVERSAPGAPPIDANILAAIGVLLPLPDIQENAPIGFFNISPDFDGFVRRVPMLVRYDGQFFPTLALRSLILGLGIDPIFCRNGLDGLESIKVGEFTIPVDPSANMLIAFQGPSRTYPYYSAADILQDKIPAELLEGRIVFIGTSAPGLLDIRAMPFDQLYPGVEVHASTIDTIVNGNHLFLPAWAPGVQALAIVVAGLLGTLAFGFAGPRIYLPLALVLMGGAIGISRWYFMQGTVVSPLYILLTIGILGAILPVLRFWQEERQKRMLRSTFSRYVSPEVVKRITKQSGELFAGEEKELTILFTDIRGFTSISEKLTPQQIVTLLNRYFTPMTNLVRGSEGTLDKFIGDALMAFWNAPLDIPDHPARAVEAALSMHVKLKELNVDLLEDYGITVAMGAGLHTGLAYVGNMGSDDLVNYTLIGDNVNLASRIEGLCPQYGITTSISGDTMHACGLDRFAYQYIDTLRVKGKEQPVEVYSPMFLAEGKEREQELAQWEHVYTRYKTGDFSEAMQAVDSLRESFPEKKLYAVYAERLATLIETPPENWTGIWTLKSK